MYLKKLTAINFKSLRQVELDFDPKITCFVGNNGQGKTNLLDSIYYLSMCKSALNSADSQVVTHGEQFFMLQGLYQRLDCDETIHCGFKLNEGKVFKRNNKAYNKLSEHVGLLPLVSISPADAALVSDSGPERRKYMNSVIAQYDRLYLDEVIRYNHTLQQRNSLLRNSAHSPMNFDLLDAFDEQLSTYGTSIYKKRKYFIEQLIPIFQTHYTRVSGRDEAVSLAYRSQLQNTNMPELLSKNRERDRTLQHTSVGIHRDDMVLTINGFPMKREGSQGQQKTYLIALKLAQLHFIQSVANIKPILLLDDIFDKLDIERVTKLVNLVAQDDFGQVFITDTNLERLSKILSVNNIHYKLFEVIDGQVEHKTN